jgi:hypothetical protein
MSFIDGYLVEINQFPRSGDLYTVKDYFYYNSYTQEYGYRDTIIPKEHIINNIAMSETLLKEIINNKIPAMRRVIDLNKQTESWIFEPTLKETEK